MVLENISTTVGASLTNDISYWLLVIIVSFFVFLGMKFFDIPKMYAGISSLLLTVFLLEFFLKAVFGTLNIPLSFGTYVVNIPFYTQITLTDGVMIMRFLDVVFNFGFARLVGIPYYENFITASKFVPAFVAPMNIFQFIGSVLSSPFNMFVFIYTSADSILEYIFFYYLFFAIIIFLSDLFGGNTEKWQPLAYLMAVIPVLLYNLYVSNPIYEYGQAMPELMKVYYFLFNGDSFSRIIFIGTLIISFLLVMEILAAVISLFLSFGESTFRPGWVSMQWEFSTQGLGFLYTLAFSVMYAMHQYPWYVFFPALILYSLFKKFSSGTKEVVRAHNEKQEMKDYVTNLVRSGGASNKADASEGTSIMFWAVALVLVGVIVYILIQLKWIPFL